MPWSDVSLGNDAQACLRAAVAAVDPSRLVAEFLAAHPDYLPPGDRVRAAAVGKAAAAMMRGALSCLPGRLDGGVVIVPEGTETHDLDQDFDVYRGGHPVPTEAGERGAHAVRDLASKLDTGDVLLCLISGGGSALMALPYDGLTLADLRLTTEALLRAGATIHELNCVRKHLDQLKGGGLAVDVAPARAVALVLSDVVGDPLDVIASGPLAPDSTTFADALAVLERRSVARSVPESVRAHLAGGARGELPETPGADHPSLARVEAHVIGNNRIAAEAALERARELGYRTLLLTTELTGEAREVGRVLAALGREVRKSGRPLPAPACLLAAGETTVTVRGNGRGGRNQEVAVGAALALDGAEGIVVAAMGTDGIDGPTDAAGGFGWGSTLSRAAALGLDPFRALEENDTYPFLKGLGDLIVTGSTGTNVMDVILVMVRP